MITLEDVNSVDMGYINEIYTIITTDLDNGESVSVLYDFINYSHTIDETAEKLHTFVFEVRNSLWNGRYAVNKPNDYYLSGESTDVSVSGKTITVHTTESALKLMLHLCSFSSSGGGLNGIPEETDAIHITKNQIGTYRTFNYWDRQHRDTRSVDVELQPGIIHLKNDEYASILNWKVLVEVVKTNLVFDLNSDLTVGKVNHVPLGVDSHYLPTGDLVDGAELDIVINYKNTLITAEYDGTVGDYCFDLDLTDKLDDANVNLAVIVNESDYVNPSSHNVRLSCEYPTVSSFSELTSSIVAGAEAIRLTGDITFNSDLVLSNPLYMICDGYKLQLSGNSIIVNGSCRIDDAIVTGGSPCFIQGANSKLSLNNCRFENASISDEHKGSVISTLPVENILTELNSCIILNSHHSIWHNGTLTVDKTRALYDNYNSSVDTDYSAFLTMVDGECEITNSVFDIDYSDLCTDEIDIKFAESLISISPDAILNNVIGSRLASNNGLNYLFDTNLSHVYVKYYYPDLETCIITSPLLDYEDKACCHHIIGTDKIFKDNVQITRADAHTENTNRKISWEDI